MNAPALANPAGKKMTVEEFLEWEEGRDGRHEMLDGRIFTMQSERIAHAVAKMGVAIAMRDSIRKAGLPCQAFVDGVSIKIDNHSKFEPDASVSCKRSEPDAILLEDPVIVVEVTSPSSQKLDAITKFTRYFTVPSIEHYLIVLISERSVVHHQRDGETITTKIIGETGKVTFDPPGFAIDVADIFIDLPEAVSAVPAAGS